MAAEHPFIRRSKMWPKHTSDAVLEMHPDYANAIRQSLEHLTTPLTQVADDLKVNYRTLQSYATMQRGTPPAVGELLVKYLRHRIHNLTVLADFLDPLLKAEAERERDVREVQEKREREIEKRWGEDSAMKADYRAGYFYVLVHPSDPNLYKVGVTVLHPEKRLAQHNSQLDKHAGRIVRETGQKWELKTYIAVPDPYWAERAFWGATMIGCMPFRGGIEVDKMVWEDVQAGLNAAAKAGIRPPQPPPRIAKSRAWVNAQLEGTGITLTARRYPGPAWVAEYQCAKGHVFTERTKEVVARKSCPCCVDWDWADGYWGKGLRASLR